MNQKLRRNKQIKDICLENQLKSDILPKARLIVGSPIFTVKYCPDSISTVFVTYLSTEGYIPNNLFAALLWIILLFISINAAGKSFLQTNNGRHLFYFSQVSPQAYILGKHLFTSGLVLVLMVLVSGLCYFLFSPKIESLIFFAITIFLGVKSILKTAIEQQEVVAQKQAFYQLISQFVSENLVFDERLTDKLEKEAYTNISPALGMVQKGELIISDGDIINAETFQKLESLRIAFEGDPLLRASRQWLFIGQLILVGLIVSLLMIFLYLFRKDIFQDHRKLQVLQHLKSQDHLLFAYMLL